MKKHLLLAGLAISVGFSANAQVSLQRMNAKNPKFGPALAASTKEKPIIAQGNAYNKSTSFAKTASVVGTKIGSTSYDTHHNGMLVNVPGTGKLSAAWTGSQVAGGTSWPDRGTYYNF